MHSQSYLWQLVAEALIQRIQVMRIKPQVLVNFANHSAIPGYDLASLFPEANLVNILAHGIERAPKCYSANNTRNNIIAVASDLPFANASVDVLIANLLLPFGAKPFAILKEWRRILNHDGLVMFACLSDASFHAWQHLLHIKIKPNLVGLATVGDALLKLGFSAPVIEAQQIVLEYSDHLQLLTDMTSAGILSHMVHEPSLPLAIDIEIIYAHAWVVRGTLPDPGTDTYIPIGQITRS